MDAKLAAIIAKINKDHGAGAVIRGSDIHWDRIPRITSGCLSLDVILGGGWPANQWHEIIGQESSGKTAMVYQSIAANQRLNPDWEVWWLAGEPFDAGYAVMNGVDLARLHLHDTNVMEEGLQAILEVGKARSVDCIVVDSYPALVPTAEDDKESGEMSPGRGAQLLNQFFRKQGSSTRRSLLDPDDRPITCFLINQWREQIGVMYGDPRTTPGGKGKNFAAVTRVEARKGEMIKPGGGEPAGQTIFFRTIKNKSARPGRVASVDYYFADVEGHQAGRYDTLSDIVNVGIAYGIFTNKGAWYYYGEDRWQGRSALLEAIRSDDGLAEKIKGEVLGTLQRSVGIDAEEEATVIEPAPPPKESVTPKKRPPKKKVPTA